MATQGSGSSGGRQQERQLVLSRRCVWFHHIKNLEKRKSIVQWGRELCLGGWSKPGFPGIVLVEVCCAGMLLPAAACCACCASSTGRLLLPGLGSCCLPAPSRCRLKLWLRVLHGSCTACCSQPPALSHVHLTALHPLPSFIASQGAGCDIDEYLSRLRRLRWQAMAVRGEEDESMATQQVCVGSMQAVCDL